MLFITGEYPPTVGGVGDYTATLAAHLRAAGARVAVVTGRVAGACNEPGVWREVPDWGLGSWRAIDRAIAAERPNLIHIQYQAGAFGGRAPIHLFPWRRRLRRRMNQRTFGGAGIGGLPILPTPLLVTFHDLHAPYLFPKAGPLRPAALQLLARGCAATIVTNGEDYHRLGADRAITKRLQLIPIGSNIPRARDSDRRGDVRARLGVGEEEILLAHFGLIGASKGVDTLLDALRLLEERTPGRYRLLLVGGEASATDRAQFGDGDGLIGALRARGLAGRVIMTGTLPPLDVAAHLAAADLAVLPYRDGASWRRGSLLAALAQGLPVVTTMPAPGYNPDLRLPSLVDGENALLVAAGVAAALAAAIMRAGDDSGLRARLAAGTAEVAATFAWETIAARHLAVYDRLRRDRIARLTGRKPAHAPRVEARR